MRDLTIKKQEREEIERKAKKILNRFNYGDIIPYSYFLNELECERNTFEFASKVAQIKEILIENGCVLKTELNEGYRILQPNEVAGELVNKYVKGSLTKLAKAIKIAGYIDKNLLNEAEKEELENISKAISENYATSYKSFYDMSALIGQAQTLELEGK